MIVLISVVLFDCRPSTGFQRESGRPRVRLSKPSASALLQNLRHEARVQAVRDYYASKGIRRGKKKCRGKFLSKEKYMQVITYS